MFWTVLNFELRDHLRRASTYIFFVALFVLALSGVLAQVVEGASRVFLNSPYTVAKQMIILAMIGQVVTAAIVGMDAVRDFRWRTDELLFTTPLNKTQYLGGRFTGVCVVMLVMYCAIPLGLAASAFMPWMDSTKLLPFSAVNYFNPFFIIVLPGVLATTALFFAVGLFTRNELAIYTQGLILLAAQSVASALLASVDRGRWGALLDPFGFNTLDYVTRYWTITEKNGQLFILSSLLLGNHLLWITIAATALAIGWSRFRLQARQSGGGSRLRSRARMAQMVTIGPCALPEIATLFDRRTLVRQLGSVAWFSLQRILRDKAFLAVCAAGLLNALTNAWYAGQWYGTPMYPVTGRVADAILVGSQFYFVILVIIYAGELAWRERQLGASGVVDVFPVAAAVPLSGQLLGLRAAEGVLSLMLLAGGVAVQALRGYSHFELPLYGQFLFGIQFPTLVAYTLLAFFVHSVVNNKYTGHFLLIVFYVFTHSLSALGFDHQLFRFGMWPDFIYSEMNGFGRYSADIAFLSAVWIFIGLVLGVASYLFWARGSDERWVTRLRRVRARLGPIAAGVTILSALGALTCAALVFYNINILNEYQNSAAQKASAAVYEKTYSHYSSIAQPWLTAVQVRADLFPERNAMSLSGVQTYVNKEEKPLDTLFLSLDPTIHVEAIRWSQPVTNIVSDASKGVWIYRLVAPLSPGESIQLSYQVSYKARGFENADPNNAVVGNGTYLNPDEFTFTPRLGYQPYEELKDSADRKHYGLQPKPRMHLISDRAALNYIFSDQAESWIDLDSIVSTTRGQTAIAPGQLVSQWTEINRPVFHYHTTAPALPAVSFLSANYAIRTSAWRPPHGRPIPISVYFDPEHGTNVARMLEAAKRSLAYCVANFGPYQFRQLRIVEVPSYTQAAASSGPGTIAFAEWPGFLMRVSSMPGSLDMPSLVTAHEVSHQWWAHQVIGADVQGRAMLTESIAEYTSLMVMEHADGAASVHRFLRYELARYLAGRSKERLLEMPLALAESGQDYIYYHKGALAFYALQDYLGEAKVNSVLRAFLAHHRFTGPPFPTSQDLIGDLRAATPAAQQHVITDLFDTITLWNFRVDSASAKRRPDGRFDLQLRLAASKTRADGLGHETSIPINDDVDVGVFGAPSNGDALGTPIVVRKYHLSQPLSIVTLTVDHEPKLAGLDPYNKLIDRTPDNNVVPITIQHEGN
jgi:ABC-2 type transport system permease protein